MNRNQCELRAGLAVASLLLASAAVAADADDIDRALERLESDDLPDRFEGLEALEEVLESVTIDSSDEAPARLERVFRRLGSYLRDPSDDWFAVQALDSAFATFGWNDAFAPLPCDALRSPSPNLRSRGVRWFAVVADPAVVPELEALWRSETRTWIRADLMVALAQQGVREHHDDLLATAGGEDATLARSAVRALGRLDDPAAVPVLAGAARSGVRELRLAALEALNPYTDSPEALDAVLEVSSDPDDKLRATAISLLAGFGEPRAAHRLEQVVRSTDAPHLRTAALWALVQRDDPRVDELAYGLARNAGEAATVREAAETVLLSRGLNPTPRESATDVDGIFQVVVRTGGCGLGARPALSGEVSFGRIVPAAGTHSVRCWQAPGIEDGSEIEERVRERVGVEIRDHFERDRDLWLHVMTDEGDECWLREDSVEKLEERVSDEEVGDEDTDSQEFDLPAEQLDSIAAAILRDAQLLDVIEEGDLLVGVVLREPTTEAMRAALAKADEAAPDELADRIDTVLQRLDSKREP